MNKQLLLQCTDEKIVEVLQYLHSNPQKEIRINDWQRYCGIGLARAARIFEVLVSAEIISEVNQYIMQPGKDGKRHRKYLPSHLIVSVDELESCIKLMKSGIQAEQKIHRIGIIVTGEDAPGINAAFRAVVLTAVQSGIEVMAIYDGFSGLINGEAELISGKTVLNTVNRGGSILYPDHFIFREDDVYFDRIISACKDNGIDALAVIGDDKCLQSVGFLASKGMVCAAIPTTIFNSISATDNTIGFDTAVNTVIQMTDCLRNTCESHARCNIVEIPGFKSGELTLVSALASAAQAAVIQEYEFDTEKLFRNIIIAKSDSQRSFLVFVSYNMKNVDNDFSEKLREEIETETKVETKLTRFADVIRGGSPSAADRLLASRMGKEAVKRLIAGKSGIVICQQNNELTFENAYTAYIADLKSDYLMLKYKNNGFSHRYSALSPLEKAEVDRMYERRLLRMSALNKDANPV